MTPLEQYVYAFGQRMGALLVEAALAAAPAREAEPAKPEARPELPRVPMRRARAPRKPAGEEAAPLAVAPPVPPRIRRKGQVAAAPVPPEGDSFTVHDLGPSWRASLTSTAEGQPESPAPEPTSHPDPVVDAAISEGAST
jgi:hypothetical protein